MRINLILRLDDFSTISNSEFEKKLLSLMEKYNVPCTFGVVPFVYQDEYDSSIQVEHPLSQENVQMLRPYVEEGLVEIALHGFHHNTQATKLNGYVPGEFFGISQEEQEDLIVRGKAYLDDTFSCNVTTFIPPWNTYDEATLGALKKLEFSCISTGNRFGPVISNASLLYLPALCKLSDVLPVINEVLRIGLDEAVIVVCFHHYEFVEVSPNRTDYQLTIDQLEELFSRIQKMEGVSLYTVRDFASRDTTLTAERYLLTSQLVRNTNIVPPVIKGWLPAPKHYPSVERARKLLFRVTIGSIGYYFLMFLSSIALGLFIGLKLTNSLLIFSVILVVALLLYTIVRIRLKGKINYRTLSLMLFSGGLGIGFLLTELLK